MEEDFEDDEQDPTLVEILIGSFVEPVVTSTVQRLRSGIRTAVEWAVQRLVAGGVVAAILVCGILLVLAAGVKGLEALGCPLWLSYLTVGVLSIILALLLVKRALPPKDES